MRRSPWICCRGTQCGCPTPLTFTLTVNPPQALLAFPILAQYENMWPVTVMMKQHCQMSKGYGVKSFGTGKPKIAYYTPGKIVSRTGPSDIARLRAPGPVGEVNHCVDTRSAELRRRNVRGTAPSTTVEREIPPDIGPRHPRRQAKSLEVLGPLSVTASMAKAVYVFCTFLLHATHGSRLSFSESQ